MLEFHCDKCGKPVDREHAVQVRIVFFAYSAGEEKVPIYRELCPDCALDLDAILCPGEEDKEREALKSSWGWKDAFEPEVTHREEPAMEGPGTRMPISEERDPCREAPKYPCGEGRCITLARIRAGMSQSELAERCYIGQGTISNWERGLGGADWLALEKALPELAEIHHVGCAAVCEYGAVCSQDEGCRYKGFRMGYGG